jgi:hypothetical protein
MVSLLNCSREAPGSNLSQDTAVRRSGGSVRSIRTNDELGPQLRQVLFITDPYHLVTHQISYLSTLHTWSSGCVRKQTANKAASNFGITRQKSPCSGLVTSHKESFLTATQGTGCSLQLLLKLARKWELRKNIQ